MKNIHKFQVGDLVRFHLNPHSFGIVTELVEDSHFLCSVRWLHLRSTTHYRYFATELKLVWD